MYYYKLKNGEEIETAIFVPPEYESMLEDLRELQGDGQNPNMMTDKQKEATWHSLTKFGWIYPIVTNKEGCFADGEQRVDTCTSHGEFFGPVLRLQVEVTDRRLLRQVLNKLKGTHDKLLDAEEFKRIIEANRANDLKALLSITDDTLERYDKILDSAESLTGAVIYSIFEAIISALSEPDLKRIMEDLKSKGYENVRANIM